MADQQPQPLCHKLLKLGLWFDPIRWNHSLLNIIGCRFLNIDPEFRRPIQNKLQTDLLSSPWARLSRAVSPGLTELLASHPNPTTRLDCLTEILASGSLWEGGPFPDRRYEFVNVFSH